MDFVPLVREFLNMFHSDLPVVHSDRDIDFYIV